MAWTPDFLTALSVRTAGRRYLLQVVEVWREPGVAYAIGSHTGMLAGQGTPLITGVAVSGPSVTPRSWTGMIGQWNVTIAGDLSELFSRMARGTMLELLMGTEGMVVADFERVAVGQLRDLRGTGPTYTLEVLGPDAACRQRLDGRYTQNRLFGALGTTTTLAAAYTPGDTSIEVVNNLGFDQETGAKGAFRITPTAGDPFYLTYTGTATAPFRFTGVSAAGVCGTMEVAAAIGDEVEEVAYLAGHPLDIARKILVSQGSGNGVYDTYPLNWGVGMLDEFIDHDDIDQVRDTVVTVAAGTYKWEWIQTAPADNAYAWLVAFLAPAGLILTTRQGCLTIRAAQDSQAPALHSGITITDADISSVKLYEAFDSRHSPEYTNVLVTIGASTSGAAPADYGVEDAATLPSANRYALDLSDRVFANETEHANEVHTRIQQALMRVPERIGVVCAGTRLAQLANLDQVYLTTTRIQSRRDGRAGFTNRPAVIESVSPRWGEAAVDVVMWVYPETGDDFA